MQIPLFTLCSQYRTEHPTNYLFSVSILKHSPFVPLQVPSLSALLPVSHMPNLADSTFSDDSVWPDPAALESQHQISFRPNQRHGYDYYYCDETPSIPRMPQAGKNSVSALRYERFFSVFAKVVHGRRRHKRLQNPV